MPLPLRKTRSKAVFVALAEVLLVALGVGLAFWVEAWQSDRGDREREREYLALLHADFRTTQRELQQSVNTLDRTQGGVRWLLEASDRNRSEVDPDSTRSAILSAFMSAYTRPAETALADMKQSGHYGLIQSDSLRYLLAAWEAHVAFLDQMREKDRDQWIMGIEPWVREHLMMSEVTPNYRGFQFPGDPGSADLRWVVSDPGFRRLIALRIIEARDLQVAYEGLIRATEGIVEQLEVALPDLAGVGGSGGS
jgi:hypothetical protein